MTNRAGQWWPQPGSLRVTGDKQWAATVHFGSYGEHAVYIVKANELGAALINYYRKVTNANLKVWNQFKDKKEILDQLPRSYQGIEMNKLPKGFEIQAKIDLDSRVAAQRPE